MGKAPFLGERFFFSGSPVSAPDIFNIAMAQLNLLRPELILSVGDLIDGGTEDREQLIKEWEHFD